MRPDPFPRVELKMNSGKKNISVGNRIPDWATVVVFAAGYFCCALVSDILTTDISPFVHFWLPGGLYVAALLLNKRKLWPFLILAAYAANISFDLYNGQKFYISFLFSTGNTLEASIGAFLVRRIVRRNLTFSSIHEVFAFTGFSALLSTTVSATVGTLVVTLLLGGTSILETWFLWWSGDIVGILLFAPLLIIWKHRIDTDTLYSSRARVYEFALSSILLVLFSVVVFNQHWITQFPLKYLLVPCMVWFTLRFGCHGATAGALMVALVSSVMASKGFTDVAVIGLSPISQTVSLQLFLATLSFVGVSLGAVLSERRQAEEALRESNDLFSQFLFHSPIYTYIKEVTPTESRVLRASENFEEMIGIPGANMIGKTMGELFPADLAAKMATDDWSVVSTGSPLTLAEDFNGRHYTSVKFPISRQGKAYLAGYTIDVTDRMKTEEALREGERSQKTILQTALDGFWLVDMQRRLLDVNDAYCQMSGYSKEELLTMSIPDIEVVETPEVASDRIEKLIKDGGIRFESRHRRKDGNIIDVEVSVTYQPAADRMVAFLRDITERKRAEEALRESEEQLRQSQKLESVGRLAGGVAHDFNNLLTTIIGYSDLLFMEHDLDDATMESIQEIRKSADRAAALTQQLLAYSRKQVLQPQEIDINELIVNAVRMLSRLIPADVTILTNLDPEIGHVRADPTQIDQVLMNLAVNAKDAMPEGGTFTIKTANVYFDESYQQQNPEVLPGDYVEIEVIDTGHGMYQETVKHIFEPFYTTKDIGSGTGLGLATVYGIVKQSDGYINVESKPDHGTAFRIYLPQIEVEGRQARPLERRSYVGGDETILIVEDEEALRKLATTVLSGLGYSVIESSNGQDALLRIAESGYPVIGCLVTDMIMPAMGGKELAETLLEKYPSLRTLFISGYTEDLISHDGVLGEGVSFLQKPFSPQSLAEKVREVLDGD